MYEHKGKKMRYFFFPGKGVWDRKINAERIGCFKGQLFPAIRIMAEINSIVSGETK